MAKKEPKKVTFIVKGKNCILREPNFEDLSFGLSALTTIEGNVNMVGAGKAIYDICVFECDKEIKETPKYMVSLCLKIAEEYLQTVQVEIKKN
ncbi:hypothetical protein LCGC14_1178700 [marine sediment metagenome]|uniref:Uncharacterized protein n=1 Tax=marine sediment metagenome TaxID=412755 RepID=A0A0F9LSM0_9ZZZZ|nr:hypothetical protein [Pricia sp.]